MVEGQEMGVWNPWSIIPSVCIYFNVHLSIVKGSRSFGNPSQLPSPMQKEYGVFAEHFVTNFAPEIFKVYLHQVELYISGQAWLSKKCQYQIFQFFTEWCAPAFNYSDRDAFTRFSTVLSRSRPGYS